MEVEWLYVDINNKKIRINKNDSMDIYSWRDYVKKPYWYKLKLSDTLGYYRVCVNYKNYRLNRLVYKAHNKDWDITDVSKNNFIDHINRNKIDNRIENLRILTNQQNQFNANIKGYSWCKHKKRWRACIRIDDNQIHLGYFKKEEDAREAYLKGKEVYHKI